MNWKKHGLVWISVGAIITGVIWYDREDPRTIYTEDYVEILSGVMERDWAFVEGTNTPSFASNSVPYYMSYNILNDKFFLPLYYLAIKGNPGWLMGDVSDKQKIASCGFGWINAGVVDHIQRYELPDVIDAYNMGIVSTQHILTTSSRMPSEEYTTDISRTNAPFAYLTGVSYTGGAICEDPNAGNWWSTTNLYKFTPQMTTNRAYTVDVLDEMNHALTNMYRTIHVTSAPVAQRRLTTNWDLFYSTSTPSSPSFPANNVSAMWSYNSGVSKIEENFYNVSVPRKVISCTYFASWLADGARYSGSSSWNWRSSSTTTKSITANRCFGCSTGYPPVEAIKSNMVERVRVYVVLSIRYNSNILSTLYPGCHANNATTVDYANLNAMLSNTFGYNVGVASIPSIPVGYSSSYPIVEYLINTNYDFNNEVILNLLHDESDPTSEVLFDFGVTSVNVPDLKIKNYTRSYSAGVTVDRDVRRERWTQYREMIATHFVTVVDWKFTHPYIN